MEKILKNINQENCIKIKEDTNIEVEKNMYAREEIDPKFTLTSTKSG